MSENQDYTLKQLEEKISGLEDEKKKLERALDNKLTQSKKEIRERLIDELHDMGEIETCLKLHLKKLRETPKAGVRIRDRAENLKKELEQLLCDVENANNECETEKQEDEEEKAEDDEKEEEVEEEVEEEIKIDEEIEKKLEQARDTIKSLEERIKHFDRIDRELSTKLDTLASRTTARKVGTFLGGFLIFLGGMIMTGGMILTLASDELPFMYSMFDIFFNYLLIVIGGIMVASGFLHQV